MRLVSTTKVDSKHHKYTFSHKFKKRERPQQFDIISFDADRAQAKAWDHIRNIHQMRKAPKF